MGALGERDDPVNARAGRAIAVVVAAAAGTALAGCGEKHDVLTPRASLAQPLNVILDTQPDANHVGLYEALDDGEFQRAGLHVRVRAPAAGTTALAQLSAGKADVAVADETDLVAARDRGEPLVAIGAIVQRPLASVVSLGFKHITAAADLRGKRVGDRGLASDHAYLTTILTQAGIPLTAVRELDVGSDLDGALTSGRVDAVLGASWNIDAIALRQKGRRPNVIHLEDAGVPDFDGLVLVTRETTLAGKTNELRRFVQAMARGYEAVRADPRSGIGALERANPDLGARLAGATVRATLPAFFPAERPWGWQDQSQWNAYGKWMLDEHLTAHGASVADASTNQLLAGQGP